MCCKEDQECCDEKKYNFELFVDGKGWPVKEDAGKEFAEWLVRNVGGDFYKGMIENLRFVKIHYDYKE